MNKITDALLKAQFLLKDNSELSQILGIIAVASESCDDEKISDKAKEAIAVIEKVYNQKVS
jgi:hypothetical protein